MWRRYLALLCACLMGQRRLVEMALGKGADWSVAAEQIGRPEDAAVRNGNLDCASLVQVSEC